MGTLLLIASTFFTKSGCGDVERGQAGEAHPGKYPSQASTGAMALSSAIVVWW